MEKSHFLLDNFQIQLLKTDIDLTIEAENQINGISYALKITTDVVPELSNNLFNDVHDLMAGLVEAFDKSTQDTTIKMNPDGKLKFSNKIRIGKIEKTLSFEIILQERKLGPTEKLERQVTKLSMRLSDQEKKSEEIIEKIIEKIKHLEEILRSSFTNHEKQTLKKFEELCTRMDAIEGKISNRFDVLEKKKQEITLKINPCFDPNHSNKNHFTFSNNNKTTTFKASTIWYSSIFAQNPLPTNRKQEFSVKIEVSSSNGSGIMIGISPAVHKSLAHCYSCKDSYFFYVYNSHLYYNGNTIASKSVHTGPAQGKIINVIIDFDSNEICFKVNGVEFHKMSIDLTSLKSQGIYPCVNLQYLDDSVSFI